MNFSERIQNELAELKAKGSLRRLSDVDYDGKYAVCGGRRLLNFSGNDYLGIAADAALKEEYLDTVSPRDFRSTLSAASSRLLTGNSRAYTELEAALSAMYGNRAALVFNSGYHANIGILPALAGKGDVIFSDKLNHASIIDGLKLCEAEHRRYPHGDLAALERLLESSQGKYRQTFIVSESVFSMDGDVVSPAKLVAIKERYHACLVLDEAHAVGLFGPHSGGFADLENCVPGVDVLVGTFGKALGSVGAFAITTPEIREYLVNRMRSLIFSTGLPPLELAWSTFVLKKLPALEDRRIKLRAMGDRLRAILVEKGLKTGGTTQIVPAIVGENTAALALAEKLRAHDILAFAIRPPTVPQGTARLRLSLSGAMDAGDIEHMGVFL